MHRSRSPFAHPRRERGVALVISLVLLVALTIVGIATLSGTRLNERVSSNAQQKSVAFEVAESAIHAAWQTDGFLSGITSTDEVRMADLDATLSSDFDQSLDGETTFDVTASVTGRFCGEGGPGAGTELNVDRSAPTFVGYLYDIEGHADIEGSNARANHVQRVKRSGMRTATVGTCTTPGL